MRLSQSAGAAPYIADVTPGGSAHDSGLVRGMHVRRLNGSLTSSMPSDDVAAAMNADEDLMLSAAYDPDGCGDGPAFCGPAHAAPQPSSTQALPRTAASPPRATRF